MSAVPKLITFAIGLLATFAAGLALGRVVDAPDPPPPTPTHVEHQ